MLVLSVARYGVWPGSLHQACTSIVGSVTLRRHALVFILIQSLSLTSLIKWMEKCVFPSGTVNHLWNEVEVFLRNPFDAHPYAFESDQSFDQLPFDRSTASFMTTGVLLVSCAFRYAAGNWVTVSYGMGCFFFWLLWKSLTFSSGVDS